MKSIHCLPLAIALVMAPCLAFAADPAQHGEHRPEAQVANMAPAKAPEQAKKMDTQMKTMRDMHEKMMNAKTPEEHKALMAEHMKTMRDGTSTMNGMMGMGADGAKAMSPQTMQKQMNMRRVPSPPPFHFQL